MKITQFRSSTFILELGKIKILFDPWLVNGEYYGSWYQYPEYNLEENLDKFNVDYICITHIHPDHFSRKTLSKLNKDIPILILNYSLPFLKKNIERLGFNVIEVESGNKFNIDNLEIFFFAADNCDPVVCQKIFGCGNFNIGKKNQSNFIDSIVVIKDNLNEQVLVNTNDCLYKMAETTSKKIKKKFPNINLLMTGYSGAGSYPQCFENLSTEKKILEGKIKYDSFLKNAKNFVNLFNPNYVIPFAGQYELAGKLSNLNEFRGVPNLIEAKNYLNSFDHIKCVVPALEIPFEIQDLSSAIQINNNFYDNKNSYLQKISKKKLDYEFNIKKTDINEIKLLINKAYKNFEEKRKFLKFQSDTNVYINLNNESYLLLKFDGSGFKYLKSIPINQKKYIIIKLDINLLRLILMGPAHAHWNNAEIGSHINFFRKPDTLYERGMHYCLNFFHV